MPLSSEPQEPFNLVHYLSTETAGRLLTLNKSETIYTQGGKSNSIYYITSGKVRLSVMSPAGREVTIALVHQGSYFGESVIQNSEARTESATALVNTCVLRVDRLLVIEALKLNTAFSISFVQHLLSSIARYKDDLGALFSNSSEERLARLLLELGDAETAGVRLQVIPKLSHKLLAEIVGTTRSRISFFMSRFNRLGLLEYKNGVSINRPLLAALVNGGLLNIDEKVS